MHSKWLCAGRSSQEGETVSTLDDIHLEGPLSISPSLNQVLSKGSLLPFMLWIRSSNVMLFFFSLGFLSAFYKMAEALTWKIPLAAAEAGSCFSWLQASTGRIKTLFHKWLLSTLMWFMEYKIRWLFFFSLTKHVHWRQETFNDPCR